MSEETAVAAPSAAQESTATPTFEIPRSSTPEYQKWRETGELPDKKTQPKAESAPASSETDEVETSPASEAAPKQDLPKRDNAETRKAQLTAEIKDLLKQRDLLKAEVATPKTPQTAPSPVKQQPQADVRPTPEDKDENGNPKFKTYEDYVEAVSDWKAEQKWAAKAREQQQQAQRRELDTKVSEARTRYGAEKFDQILQPTVNEIVSDQQIPVTIKALISESDMLPDLIYVLGSDAKAKADFLHLARTNPGQAIRYITKIEAGIESELSAKGSSDAGRNEKGQFVKSEPEPAPAKRGPESAPEPPIEIGNRGSGPMDESERALKAAQRGDPKAFRAWKEAEDAKEMRRRRGA